MIFLLLCLAFIGGLGLVAFLGIDRLMSRIPKLLVVAPLATLAVWRLLCMLEFWSSLEDQGGYAAVYGPV